MQSELESAVLEKSTLKERLHQLEQQLTEIQGQKSALEHEIMQQKLNFDFEIENLKTSIIEEQNMKASREASEKIQVR